CADGYYGNPSLASGSLCRPCPCPDGPNSGRHFAASCYQDNRSRQIVCNCIQGYTGARCDECAPGYHGNPSQPGGRCKPCQCSNNIDMSDMGACDRRSGECRKCLYNTEGPSCGICKSGYYGDASRRNCRTLVGPVPVSGQRDRPDAFRDLEEKLAQAQGIVNARNATATAVGTLMELIEDLRARIGETTDTLNRLEGDLTVVQDSNSEASKELSALEREAKALNLTSAQLHRQLDILKNSNFLGAYDSIRSSYNRSRDAERRANESTTTRPSTVCGAPGDVPCADSPCGGAGCRDDEGKRRCGGLNCDGAVAVAGNALESAKRAEKELNNAMGEVEGLFNKVAEAKSKAEEAKGKAQAALDKATATKNKVERSNNDLRDLIKQTREFLTQEGADPDSIEAVANRVLELSIPASPQQIQYLAEEIKERVRSLSNVDAILEQTQDDVRKAEQLLLDAKRAR
ncbi:hypothetical protein CRUP_000035, partial [Coryphaenoides rupestris]